MQLLVTLPKIEEDPRGEDAVKGHLGAVTNKVRNRGRPRTRSRYERIQRRNIYELPEKAYSTLGQIGMLRILTGATTITIMLAPDSTG